MSEDHPYCDPPILDAVEVFITDASDYLQTHGPEKTREVIQPFVDACEQLVVEGVRIPEYGIDPAVNKSIVYEFAKRVDCLRSLRYYIKRTEAALVAFDVAPEEKKPKKAVSFSNDLRHLHGTMKLLGRPPYSISFVDDLRYRSEFWRFVKMQEEFRAQYAIYEPLRDHLLADAKARRQAFFTKADLTWWARAHKETLLDLGKNNSYLKDLHIRVGYDQALDSLRTWMHYLDGSLRYLRRDIEAMRTNVPEGMNALSPAVSP